MTAVHFAPTDTDYLEKLNTLAEQADEAVGVSDTLDDHIAGTADKHAASAIVNTPAGGIAATDVQAAINELDGDKQDANANLTALAGQTGAADKVSYWTAAATLALTTLGSFGRTMIAWADAAAARTGLGLGSLATLNAAPAGTLTGTTLAAGVTASSLTSVGALTSLSAVGLSDLDSVHFDDLAFDDSGTFTNRGAVITVSRNTPAPAAVVPAMHLVAQGKGDNATFIGVSGGYFQARDRSDVTGANKGVLYGLQVTASPRVARNNVPFDDVACLVLQNDAQVAGAKGTDAVYLGHNAAMFPTATDYEWISGFTNESNSQIALHLCGSHIYGIDTNLGTFAANGFALRLKNSLYIGARNAANSANLPVIGVDSSDVVQVAGPGSGVSVNTNAATLPAAASGTVFRMGQADGTVNRLLMDAFAANNGITMRRANGTAGAPTALQTDQAIGNLFGFGYGATSYSGGRAGVGIYASENWTDTAQGAYLSFSTTAAGSTTVLERVRIAASGELQAQYGIAVTTLTATGQVLGKAGSAASPSFSFPSGSSDTGFYNISAGAIGISLGGVQYGAFAAGMSSIFSPCQFTSTVSLGGGAGSESLRAIVVASSNRWVTASGSNGGNPSLGTSAGSLAFTSIPIPPSYTVSTLPAVGTAGGLIYVSNESGGAVLAFSDGTNWRRVTDRAIVS